MKRFIVTTSIYPPSEATIKFSMMKGWTLIVVGDLKTPHEEYKKIDCIYLSPDFQKEHYPELSEAIGWNCIMRRNIGFIEAYKRGADVVASVDDDNIPYDNWGENVLIGWIAIIDNYLTDKGVFDPMRVTNYPELWHRGYPLSLVKFNPTHYVGKLETKVLIQADLWDGDPDVDAVCRMLYHPKDLKLEVKDFFTSMDYSPFNSQNTFIAREALPTYMVLPSVGRMDDIWGGYICQYLLNTRPVFGPPTVFQKRNEQSLKRNFMDEVDGHITTIELINDIKNWEHYLPENTLKAFNLYRSEYGKLKD
jgi:hypothetical protein